MAPVQRHEQRRRPHPVETIYAQPLTLTYGVVYRAVRDFATHLPLQKASRAKLSAFLLCAKPAVPNGPGHIEGPESPSRRGRRLCPMQPTTNIA